MENLKGKNIISRMNELMYYGKSTSKPVKGSGCGVVD